MLLGRVLILGIAKKGFKGQVVAWFSVHKVVDMDGLCLNFR
jgi:hypothetical protein